MDLYLEASSPTITYFSSTFSPSTSEDRSIGRPTSEAKDSLGKLSPAKPIFMQPVPGSQMMVLSDCMASIFIGDIQQSQADIMDEHHHEEHTGGSQSDLVAKFNAALSLAKSLPPSKLNKNLVGLASLCPEIEDNLLQKIQAPMDVDSSHQEYQYLKTEFNRNGNSYRNPYTNTYSPESSHGYRPSGLFRTLEENGIVLFEEYVRLYYGADTVGSFYVMENDSGNGDFSCGFFAKKVANEGDGFAGAWDSFNIVDVTFDGQQYRYSLNSTVLIEMDIEGSGINLTGFLKKSKQQSRSYKNVSQAEVFNHHLVAVGEMVEDMETVMRQHLEAIYVAKTKEIIFTTRYENTIQVEKHRMSLAWDLKKLSFSEGA